MKTARQDLVGLYLERLSNELHGLAHHQRQEIIDEVSGHIGESLAGTDAESEADVRNILDRLGDPADIAREAYARFDTTTLRSERTYAGVAPNPQVESNPRGLKLFLLVAAIALATFATGVLVVRLIFLILETRDL